MRKKPVAAIAVMNVKLAITAQVSMATCASSALMLAEVVAAKAWMVDSKASMREVSSAFMTAISAMTLSLDMFSIPCVALYAPLGSTPASMNASITDWPPGSLI